MQTCCYFFSILALLVSVSEAQSSISLAISMEIRDEAVNLMSNLKLWTNVCSYFVILVDERTVDNSFSIAQKILAESSRQFFLSNYTFTGFGEARTLGLNYTWAKFPNATHVLIADPDWRPDLASINILELDNSADVFRFTVFDRNGNNRLYNHLVWSFFTFLSFCRCDEKKDRLAAKKSRRITNEIQFTWSSWYRSL